MIKQSSEMSADLVVFSAKGIGDPPRFPLGSTAQKAMKYADASVLLVREGVSRMRRVLLATDGSKYSDAVADFLLRLSLPVECQVIVVTALQCYAAASGRRFRCLWARLI